MIMDTPDSPLVLTKLRLPAERPGIITRSRLIELLTPERYENFILVSAPAGYGKTTLLVDWAHFLLRNGHTVAWYALDPSDDDSIPFAAYLAASLTHALGSSSELAHITQLLRASPEIDLQRIMQSIINAITLSARDCVLILDDYHLITSPAIHSAVTFLLEHLPQNMHIVIGSRADPPLPLARLRAHAHLYEIRAADLRFSVDETKLFLNEVMKLDLSPQMITTLEARTEGWIAGLQLAALSLTGRADKEDFIASFAGSHRYLVEYLLEEVINRQPEEVQSFLFSTSILERMCAPLCDAILNAGSHSEAILNQLEQTNLFVVSLDDQGYWYRYHHLFRDFLQTRLLKKHPQHVTSLHKTASEWLAAHHFLREAAQQALQTHDWEYAAAFVEQQSFTMIIHSEISTIYEWCSQFPEEVMQKHPLLCIHQCWGWVFSFRRQNRSKVEARLQQVEQFIAALEDKQRASDLSEHAAVVRVWLAMAPDPTADPREQLALSQSMLANYPQGNAGQFSALLTIAYTHMALHDAQAASAVLTTARQIAFSSNLFFGVVESTFNLARLAHSQGQLHRAAELCRQGQADIAAMMAHPEQELPALGCLDIALGCVLIEQDQLKEAENHLLRGLRLMGIGMNPYYLMTAYIALARLFEILDRPADALMYLTHLEETWPDIAFCTGALRITLALRNAPEDPATLSQAAAWCQTFSPYLADDVPAPGMGSYGAAEAFYLARLGWIGAQIKVGNLQPARSILDRQLDLSLANHLTNRVIELSLLEAQLEQKEGNREKTLSALERALSLAQPAGYLRIFDQGPALTRLLVEAAAAGVCRGYIGQILAAIESPKTVALQSPDTTPLTSQQSDLGIVENLSERELELLQLMAQGATNQAIAEKLVITVGTVKSHINHILAKLNAHNRTEAVARARSLGLVKI